LALLSHYRKEERSAGNIVAVVSRHFGPPRKLGHSPTFVAECGQAGRWDESRPSEIPPSNKV
jgi:hypothetical protein